jgi:hypothetical protein
MVLCETLKSNIGKKLYLHSQFFFNFFTNIVIACYLK